MLEEAPLTSAPRGRLLRRQLDGDGQVAERRIGVGGDRRNARGQPRPHRQAEAVGHQQQDRALS
jgi:hypothetical protein